MPPATRADPAKPSVAKSAVGMQNPCHLSLNTHFLSCGTDLTSRQEDARMPLMLTKNQTIRNTLHQTKERRKSQTCHVYELEVDKSSLSAPCHEFLQRLFHEARWFYNAILASGNLFAFDARVRQVQVKTPEGLETRDLTLLSSQMKQGLLSRTQGSIRSLRALKKQGKKVGRLKFKSFVSSIPLKQPGNTYTVLDS